MTPDRRRLVLAVLVVAVAAIVVLSAIVARSARAPGAVAGGSPERSAAAGAAVPGTATLVGAGDIADCGDDDDENTAALLRAIPGTVFVAGDNAYEDGSTTQYRDCYGPGWGAELQRTLPAPGNHDYQTRGAAGYLDYYGARARPNGTTWYSTTVGAWHVIVLDSDCSAIGGCGAGSPQETWLRAELAASDARCTVAIWHHPRFSSGEHGDNGAMAAFWTDLYAAGADVVVNGHDHDYERFAPQDPVRNPDPDRGIREFVVGTGGAGLRGFGRPRPNSEVRDSKTHGVIELTLRADGYDWRFIPVAGKSFSDSGTGTCH